MRKKKYVDSLPGLSTACIHELMYLLSIDIVFTITVSGERIVTDRFD
jgi:hypothetical protein